MMMMMHLLDAWLNHPNMSVNHSKEREDHISALWQWHLILSSQYFHQFDCIRLTSDKFFDGLLILDPTFDDGHLKQIKVYNNGNYTFDDH